MSADPFLVAARSELNGLPWQTTPRRGTLHHRPSVARRPPAGLEPAITSLRVRAAQQSQRMPIPPWGHFGYRSGGQGGFTSPAAWRFSNAATRPRATSARCLAGFSGLPLIPLCPSALLTVGVAFTRDRSSPGERSGRVGCHPQRRQSQQQDRYPARCTEARRYGPFTRYVLQPHDTTRGKGPGGEPGPMEEGKGLECGENAAS